MVRTLILILVLLHCGLSTNLSHAQLFRGNSAPPAAREPARVGLLGGLREAREERFRREEQAATAARVAAARVAATQAAAAQRNAATNPRANAASATQSGGAANSNSLRRDPSLNPSPSSAASRRNMEGTKSEPNVRSSNFRGQENLGLANSKINPNNSLSRPTPVTPASATAFVPAPVGYDGPGVVIRLPKEAHSTVNYLVDEVETNAIRPGERQVYDAKGSYTVRYSRGVTRDGRSYGESRYTITEGRYRFELTPTGWELFRESDANIAPLNTLDLAENSTSERQTPDSLPGPSPLAELQRVQPSPSAERLLPASEPVSNVQPGQAASNEPASIEPIANAPAGNEEVLPAPKPRSILE